MNEPAIQTKKKPAFYNNPRNRALFYQLVLLLSLGYFFFSIISNTLANMEARGIQSGFGFLNETSGFDIAFHLISFDASNTYLRVFIVGFFNTVLVSVIGIIIATILGFIMGIAYFSNNWLIKKASIVYVEVFRNIPLLLQVVFWYSAVFGSLPMRAESMSLGEAVYLNVQGLFTFKFVGESWSWLFYTGIIAAFSGVFVLKGWAKKRQALTGQQFPVFWTSLGIIFGLPLFILIITGFPFQIEYPEVTRFRIVGGIAIPPELMALSIALSVYTGAFIAEAVRAGIQSVPNGQKEAARSLGLRENRIMSLIIVPQAMRVIVPLLNSEYQSLVKNSTLATAIGYTELFTVFVGTSLNQTGKAIEIIFMTILVYFAINMLISFFMNLINKKVAHVER